MTVKPLNPFHLVLCSPFLYPTLTFSTVPLLHSSQLALYERVPCFSCQTLAKLMPKSYVSQYRNTVWEGH